MPLVCSVGPCLCFPHLVRGHGAGKCGGVEVFGCAGYVSSIFAGMPEVALVQTMTDGVRTLIERERELAEEHASGVV